MFGFHNVNPPLMCPAGVGYCSVYTLVWELSVLIQYIERLRSIAQATKAMVNQLVLLHTGGTVGTF